MDTQKAVETLGGMFATIATDGGKALEMLGLPSGARVLDVGTGSGKFAIFLALQGFDVITGEPATDETRYARQDWEANAAKVGVADRITFTPFDASAMPFDSQAFDAVFFFGVLHHVDEALRGDVFREALRVVKPGGSVVYFEPGQDLLKNIRGKDPGHPDPANPSDYAGDSPASANHMVGSKMDIYTYTAAGLESVG